MPVARRRTNWERRRRRDDARAEGRGPESSQRFRGRRPAWRRGCRQGIAWNGSRCSLGNGPVAPITSGERLYGGGQIGAGKVGPHDIGEVQLSVGGLPQQEITQSLFSTGADEQIDV